MITKSSIYKIKRSVTWRLMLNGSLVAYNSETNTYFALYHNHIIVWLLIDGKRNISTLRRDSGISMSDTISSINAFKENGLIRDVTS